MTRQARRIGLLDHMGGGNLGDDTTQTAVMANIRSRWRDADLFAFSMNPVDTEARHAIPAYPIRRRTWDNPQRSPGDRAGDSEHATATARRGLRLPAAFRAVVSKPRAALAELIFLARSYRAVRSLDVFIISGGGQLLDSWGGPWDYPFTIFKWVVLAKIAGARCYFINVGAGPLQHPLSKFLVRHALSLADYVSFRDAESRALLRQLGFKGEAHVFPDCVYALNVAPVDRQNERCNEPVIGMSPMAYCDPRRYWIHNQAAYESFVRKLVTAGRWLSERHRLVLFSTDIWFDAQTLEKVDAALHDQVPSDGSRMLARASIMTLETLLSSMSSMDYIVTCRFHGVVFAHLMNIPVIALSHHPKVTALMADLGLSEYCLDIDSFSPESLTAAFTRMVADRAGIRSRMAEKAALYKAQLNRQFDQLFAPEAVR